VYIPHSIFSPRSYVSRLDVSFVGRPLNRGNALLFLTISPVLISAEPDDVLRCVAALPNSSEPPNKGVEIPKRK
jgi:hypothetical protein